MSAIFGMIDRLGEAIDPARAGRMMAALAHRGPDGQAREGGPGFVLGHCLLDTAGAGAAMGCLLVEGDLTITADCRIDNRDELAAALGVSDDASDTAMLLRAWHNWGEDFPKHVLGDFSVAIWNARERNLVCARDHFGIKPFYYFSDSRYFVFASEPGAVLASGLTESALLDERIADFLAGGPPELDQTSYQGMKRLPPAHIGSFGPAGWRIAAYYTLPRPPIRAWADAPGTFRTILDQAISARLRGGPAGAMLSGGLDSSSVACLAARQLQAACTAKLPTFSMVFDETPELNERPFIESVLAQGGFAPSFIPSNRLAHFAALDTIMDEQQDVYLAPNLACSRQIYHRARAEGVRVLLDGHGGDEVANAGKTRLDELAAQGRWIMLWRLLGSGLLQHGEGRVRTFWKFVKRYSRVRWFVRAGRSVRRRLGLDRPAPNPYISCINPDFAARMAAAARAPVPGGVKVDGEITEQAFHYEVLTMKLQPAAFELLDRTAAAAGVESRYPFWDRRLVEFCLSLDPAEKLDDGWGRLVLRRAMEGILPEDVQWRRLKFDFTTHLATSMVRDHAGLVMRTLDENRHGLGRYVDLPAVRGMLERLQTRQTGRPDGYEVQAIFRVMVLASLLRRQHQPAPAKVLA